MHLPVRPNWLVLLLSTSLLCPAAELLSTPECHPASSDEIISVWQDPEAMETTHHDLHQALTGDALANSTIVKSLTEDVSLRGEKAVLDARRATQLCLSGPSGVRSEWDSLPVGELSRQVIAISFKF